MTKMVNGIEVICPPEEEAAIRAEWDANEAARKPAVERTVPEKLAAIGLAVTELKAELAMAATQFGQNLLPNTNWQMMATFSGTFGTAMHETGTGPQAAVSFSGFTPGSNTPTFQTANTQALKVGSLVTIVSASNLSVSALRVSALVPNQSFTVTLPLGLLSPASGPGSAVPLGVGDLTGNAYTYLADSWDKSLTLANWVDDFPANACIGAKRVMGLRKTVAASEVAVYDFGAGHAGQSNCDYKKLAGRTVTFGALVWQKKQGGAGTWRLRVDDSVSSAFSSSGAGAAYGGYEFLSVTKTIDRRTSGVAVVLELNGAAGDVYYFALPTLVFGSSLTRDGCGPMPQEILYCTHWNPRVLTPLSMTFPATAFQNTGGLLYGFSGASCDLEAMSFGTMHKSVKAVKCKIELEMPTRASLFTGSSLTGPLMFGPQQYGSPGGKIAAQGWLPLDPDGCCTVFGDVPNMVITNATFDFDAVVL